MQSQHGLEMYIILFPFQKSTHLSSPMHRSCVNGRRDPGKGRQMSPQSSLLWRIPYSKEEKSVSYYKQEAWAIAFWASPFIFGSKQWPCRRSDSRIILLQSSWLQLGLPWKEEVRWRFWQHWQNCLQHQLGMVLSANSAETCPKDQKQGRGGDGKWGLRSLWVLTTCHHQHSQTQPSSWNGCFCSCTHLCIAVPHCNMLCITVPGRQPLP